jgi:hypothetical protein
MTNAQQKEVVALLSKYFPTVESFVCRGRDSLDFSEISHESLRLAVVAAYKAGMKAGAL